MNSPHLDSPDLFCSATRTAAPAPPKAETQLRRLTASLAHNVNNALTGVIGYLEMARSRMETGTETDVCLRSGLECAYQAADAVRRIVACAGHISAAEARAPRSLLRLVEEAADRLTCAAPHLKATVSGACAGQVFVSAGLVGLALDGLLRAATEGAPDRRELALRLANEEGCCRLYVEGDVSAPALLEASLIIEIQGGALEFLSAPDSGPSLRLSFPCCEALPVRRDQPQSAPSTPHRPAALGLLRQAV